jgi:hypothetical protein
VLKTRTAFAWSVVWISPGLGFSGLVYLWYDDAAAQQYLTGYLRGLAVLLGFVGVKLLLSHRVHVPTWASLAVIVVAVGVSVVAWLVLTKGAEPPPAIAEMGQPVAQVTGPEEPEESSAETSRLG